MLHVCLLILLVPYDVRSLSWQHKIKMAHFNGGQRFWTFQMLVSNSVVVNHVRLKFYTSIFGAIIKSLLAKEGIFSMMNFRHSSTLSCPVNIKNKKCLPPGVVWKTRTRTRTRVHVHACTYTRTWKTRTWKTRTWKTRTWKTRTWKTRTWKTRIWKTRIMFICNVN
jgi:hypothetical protein